MRLDSSFLFFLILSQFFYSQYTITGKVYDDEQKVLHQVSVQLLAKDSTIIDYCFTDSNGGYELKGNANGKILKYSSLNHKTQYINFNATKDFIQNINLSRKEQRIKEVIIFSPPKVAKLRSDSISFDLKTIRDNTERNLGDLIKKLPGLEIDSDGKVNFQGVRIDEILIDGNEFFGNKHQLATQNITAEMVDGLDLLLRHQTDKNKRDFNIDNKTVLNVKLKEKYRGEILGNIALYGGLKNKFLTKANFFKFSKNGNLSWISNSNNIGESPMSVEDYLELIGVIKRINSSSELSGSNLVNVDEFIPKYIYTDEKVKKKSNYFSALNYTYKFSKKIRFNGNTIINQTNQFEQFNSLKIFLSENGLKYLNEEKNSVSKNFILSTYLNIDFIPTKKLSLNYNILYNPSNGNSYEKISSNINFVNDYKNIHNNYGQELKITNRFNDNLLLTSTLNQSNSRFNKNLFLNANNAFLGLDFSNNDYKLIEKTKLVNANYALYNNLIFKHNKDTYKVIFNFDYFKQDFYSEAENDTNFLNNLNSGTKTIKYGFLGRNYFSLFQIQYGFNLNFYEIKKKFKKETNNFEPNVALTYEINPVNKLSFSYTRTSKNPSLFQTIQNNYIDDYQTIINPSQIELFQFSPSDNYQISYLNFTPKKEKSFNINLQYRNSKNIFSNNTIFLDSFVIKNYVLADYERYAKLLVIYDKKFTIIPFSLKSNFSYTITSGQNYIQDLQNNYRNTNIGGEFKIISHFKNSKFQMHFNYSLNNFNSKQQLNYISNNLINHRFKLHFFAVFKRFTFDIENIYMIQNSNTNDRNQFILSPSFYYFSQNNKWEIGLKSQNIFHLNENLYLTQSFSNYYIENSILYTIPGNLILGIKYNL